MKVVLHSWITGVCAALLLACGNNGGASTTGGASGGDDASTAADASMTELDAGGGNLRCTMGSSAAVARCAGPVDDGPDEAVTDEADVPVFELPDPLVADSGQPIETAEDWSRCRHPELLRHFQTEMYGTTPKDVVDVRFDEVSHELALDGRAMRKEVDIVLSKDASSITVELLLYVPTQGAGPYPVILNPNFTGNHLTHNDPGMRISSLAEAQYRAKGWNSVADRIATTRGTDANGRIGAIDRILDRGHAFATFYYGDLHPDYDDGFETRIHPLLPGTGLSAPDRWGAIGAWAWGMSRALDYFETDADVDGERAIVFGSSRLGKTALWAAAQDDRFAAVFAHLSGTGGASLSRRRFNQTVSMANHRFPYWFAPNFACYNRDESSLPIDQHMLVALIAPRPVLLGTAVDDEFDDPRGTFLTALAAHPVYALLGSEGLAATEHPGLDQPVLSPLGYYMRTGIHELTEYDIDQLLDFSDAHATSR